MNPSSVLLDDLRAIPELRLTADAELARLNTFRIGGAAELLAVVESESALRALLTEVSRRRVPFFLLGIGSNVLIPDEGLAGVVARLGGRLKRIDFEGTTARAGGAASLAKLARAAARRGLVGLEALAGFPSTVGGAVWMNAGSFGTEIRDVLVSARVVDRTGHATVLRVDEIGAGYRSTRLQQTGHIVTEAVFQLAHGDAAAALEKITELNRKRWQSLPSGAPNVGSIFKNPALAPAGKLVDECGLKGTAIGGARISPKHGNVIVNTGEGQAGDVLELMVLAHSAVAERFSVLLEPEVVLTGPLRRIWQDRTASARRRVEESTAGGAEVE
ncbi:MAG: UDP-N-acetylmuramate dehydrogenase [Acidobacteriota bacterium]|nr:UDP-N-acetylmuramate dehydrogenase [Acidobacteriota bacterium]